jgi:hypothetical protein
MQQWEALFHKATKQLKAGKLPLEAWTFGGGTALMQRFNHRLSQDIDIFFSDPQWLGYVSPRVNDAVDVDRYDEQSTFVKLHLPEGEIDFIVSRPVTPIKPVLMQVAGVPVYVEEPVENHGQENNTPQ